MLRSGTRGCTRGWRLARDDRASHTRPKLRARSAPSSYSLIIHSHGSVCKGLYKGQLLISWSCSLHHMQRMLRASYVAPLSLRDHMIMPDGGPYEPPADIFGGRGSRQHEGGGQQGGGQQGGRQHVGGQHGASQQGSSTKQQGNPTKQGSPAKSGSPTKSSQGSPGKGAGSSKGSTTASAFLPSITPGQRTSNVGVGNVSVGNVGSPSSPPVGTPYGVLSALEPGILAGKHPQCRHTRLSPRCSVTTPQTEMRMQCVHFMFTFARGSNRPLSARQPQAPNTLGPAWPTCSLVVI